MKILHFSTYDIVGGAARAAYRLHAALRDTGCVSKMIVRHKKSADKDVIGVDSAFNLKPVLKKIRNKIRFFGEDLPGIPFVFNYDMAQGIDTRAFYDEGPEGVDLIFLHWITDFLTIEVIKEICEYYRCPVAWPLVDMEPFTGGCHYSFGCRNFTEECRDCGFFKETRSKDLPHLVWRRKYDYLRGLPIRFIAPTSWVEKRVKESSLFGDHKINIIPIPIDTKVFKPGDKSAARGLLGAPRNKKVIFFGASHLDDMRKGMSYLKEALRHLALMSSKKGGVLNQEDIFLLIAGSRESGVLASMPFPYKYLGLLKNDADLALAYQAADIFVSASIEEAGPMMIPEAMLCGTLVAAFNTGGAPDLIETMKTGYLADYKDSGDLAKGIYALLTAGNLPALGAAAHEAAVGKHSPYLIVGRYMELFRKNRE